MSSTAPRAVAPPPPRVRLCLGFTGHREDNAAFATNLTAIEAALADVLDHVRAAAGAAPVRLHTLLTDGADELAAAGALQRGWELVAPLPYGLALNLAINANVSTEQEALALLAHPDPAQCTCSAEVQARATRIHALAMQARRFELADQDALITALLLAKLRAPDDARQAAVFTAESSRRVALAGRVMIEQSDLIIAVWDGATTALAGGTGHTVEAALEAGTPVVWIDANAPAAWHLLVGPESLAALAGLPAVASDRVAALQALVRGALQPAPARTSAVGDHASPHAAGVTGHESLADEDLPRRSNVAWHLYRRVEALFGASDWAGRFASLRQDYERPEGIATGSAAPLFAQARQLPGLEPTFLAEVDTTILRRYAWADAVSSRLSDTYRGGMVANFLLAPLAVLGGIAYLPFAGPQDKWLFAVFELALLAIVVSITLVGQRRRWHGRWFETRRVAEYLRHAPILLLLGVARAPGRWPLGTNTSWPEWYARHAIRDLGLPALAITPGYLRAAVGGPLLDHVTRQRDYHMAKAKRLANAHHHLDRTAEACFVLAVVSVAAYLLLKGGGALHLWPAALAKGTSYLFTFLGVLLPTVGAALASIRYFGDFERFSAISQVAAEKLQALHQRITQLQAAPDAGWDYGRATSLAHAMDEVVVSEIEGWQAVFGAKNVAVPA